MYAPLPGQQPPMATSHQDRLPHSEASTLYPAHPGDGAGQAGEVPLLGGVPPRVGEALVASYRRWETLAEEQAFVAGAAAGAEGGDESDNPFLAETPSGWAWLCGLRWVTDESA